MSVRTVKGTAFTILVDDKRIIIKHVCGKGKRCRVTIPPGAKIEEHPPLTDNLGVIRKEKAAQRWRSAQQEKS